MIKTGAIFTNFVPKADGSYSLRFNTALEVGENQLLDFHRLRGLQGWLLFADTEQSVEIPEVQPDLQTKSKSQRLRNVLYVQLEQRLGRKPSDEEWSSYYNKSMEAIINKVKDTLE